MIKKELKHFKLKVGKYDDIGASVPTSVVSALLSEGIIREPYFGTNAEQLRGAVSRGAVFTAEFEVDTVMLGYESLILRLGGVDAPLVLCVNGVPLAGVECAHLPYEIDIKARVCLGVNTLTLRFAPRAIDGEALVQDIAIHEPIELIAYSKAVIGGVVVRQDHAAGQVHLGIKMGVNGYAHKMRAVAVLVSPSGAVSYCTLVGGEGSIAISSPNFWRPGRLRPHRIYRLTVNLYSDTDLIDSREVRVGLRSVTYDPGAPSPLMLGGEPYRPVALRHVSTDLIKPRATAARTRLMLSRAVDAGVDMLYIDPKDSYPSEDFLRCCDELGIALAVRLILPSRPLSGPGEQLALREISRSLDRFANHPSVLVLTGAGSFAAAVRKQMEERLPGVVYADDLFSLAQIPPSLPTAYTSCAYFASEDMNLTSVSVRSRCRGGVGDLIALVAQGYRMPYSFGEWTYLSQLISAEAAVAELLSCTEGVCTCLGDLSEPYPAPAPSVLDYCARPKAAYYYLSRFARPTNVYAVANGLKVGFYAVNMTTTVRKSHLNYSIISNDNRVILRDSVAFSAPPRAVTLVYEYDAEKILEGHEREFYLHYYGSDQGGAYSRSVLTFVPTSDFLLRAPSITAEIVGSGSDYTVTVYSDVFARAVEVWFEGDEDAVLEDNFFDIVSSVPVRLRVHTQRPTAIESLKRELRVRSMYDVGR